MIDGVVHCVLVADIAGNQIMNNFYYRFDEDDSLTTSVFVSNL